MNQILGVLRARGFLKDFKLTGLLTHSDVSEKGGHCEGSEMTQAIHQPTAATAGLATAELILAIQKEFPQVRPVSCEPVEGEDIRL